MLLKAESRKYIRQSMKELLMSRDPSLPTS